MKRAILFLTLCIAQSAMAAQAPVTQITGITASREALRTQVNTRLSAAQSNFTELYTLLGGNPWLAQTTAPNVHNVFWIDTSGTSPTIKYWDGDSWEVAASGGDGTYTLPVASSETLGGIKVGDRLTMTDGVLSADVQTTDISGKQDTLVSGANIKTVNSTSLLGSGNIDISGSSVPDGTINGQVLLWATDQWVASIAPWLATASLGTGVATALGSAPDTAGGFLLYSSYADDPLIAWDSSTITETVDSPSAGTNTIGVKSGIFQAYDANMILWPSTISVAEVEYLNGLGGPLTTLLGAKIDDSQLDDTKGNGDAGYIWSADKVFDSLALKQDYSANLTAWAGISPSTGSINTTGAVQAKVPINSYSAAQTLTQAAHNSTIVQMTVAAEVTMWDCETANIGDTVMLWARDAEKIEVVPSTGDHFALFNGTALTADYELDVAATAGTKVTLMCTADDTWSVFSETAASTDGGVAD